MVKFWKRKLIQILDTRKVNKFYTERNDLSFSGDSRNRRCRVDM